MWAESGQDDNEYRGESIGHVGSADLRGEEGWMPFFACENKGGILYFFSGAGSSGGAVKRSFCSKARPNRWRMS